MVESYDSLVDSSSDSSSRVSPASSLKRKYSAYARMTSVSSEADTELMKKPKTVRLMLKKVKKQRTWAANDNDRYARGRTAELAEGSSMRRQRSRRRKV
jgi:hypothetical protein